jgi:aspartyl protease family protein
MRKKLLILLLCCCSCGGNSGYSVARIIDGQSIELTNGTIIELLNVGNTPENSRILERYIKGKVVLFDKDSEEITHITTSRLPAIVYNSNGDCINELLTGVQQISRNEIPVIEHNLPATNKTIVQMQLKDGVYLIPVEIDGMPLYFIFDTGASLISISSKEAETLYVQGKIRHDDFVGKGQFADANGNISEGTIINLSSVKIGNRILEDVQACIVKNQDAPLLFGQSALQKFGKISIDYNKLEITFE